MKHLQRTFLAATLLPLFALMVSLSMIIGPTTDAAAHPIPFASPTMLGGRILIQVVAPIAVFRTGPGSRFPTIARVNRLNKIELSGISQDRAWYMFKYAEKNTWISADKTITQVVLGDPKYLPVIAGPPVPTAATGGDPSYDPITCDFDNNMSDDAQDALVLEMTNALNTSDWHHVGVMARRLYRCPMDGVFYVLYTQDVQTRTAQGLQPVDLYTAYPQFTDGWNGK
jgi:hypothetical protein